MPSVSVVIPVFNGIPHLGAFFDSVNAALPAGSQVVVVDDASTEPVFDAIPDLPAAAAMLRLRNDRNVGYSATVNRGFAVATGEIIVQLNTDLLLDPRCLGAMIDVIERERNIGIVGSKLIYPTTGLVQSVGMCFGQYSKKHVFRFLPTGHPLCMRTREVQITTGATVAMTRATLDRIGPLDQRYYNHNNDLDHCLRAREGGLRNVMCADSVAYHWRSQSGPARVARVATAEARFWARWGGRYEVDLGRFVDEALDHVLNTAPDLETAPFEVLDLSRGEDREIVLDRLVARWPTLAGRVHAFPQTNNAAAQLWLPLLLPTWYCTHPAPFVYIVDSHRDLAENVLWFERRHTIVTEELIVDLSAAVVRSSELVPSSTPDQ